MTKTTIATAVLAAGSLGVALDAGNVPFNPDLAKGMVELAESLAEIMSTVELVNDSIKLAIGAFERGDNSFALQGLRLIGDVTADLVSDQDLIAAEFAPSQEEQAVVDLIRLIQLAKSLA